MPFDFLGDLFDRDGRKRHGRRSGVGGLLDRVLGGDRHDHRDSPSRYDTDRDRYERARYRRDGDDDDDRRGWHDHDDYEDRRRRRDRDSDLFDVD